MNEITAARRRAITAEDFREAADIVSRQARRERQKAHTLDRRAERNHTASADGLERVADFLRNMADE